jgi:hypothetical protein
MNYEKPELTVFGFASVAIRNTAKLRGQKDNTEDFPSTSAYDADE